MATLTRCRKSCFLNPLYDLLPRNSWLVQHGTCQARSDFLLDEATGTLPMWKPAALRLWPIRPPARPASARSSSGRSRASASLGQLADVAWLAGHTGVVSHTGTLCCPSPDNCCPNTARACQAQCTTEGSTTTCTSNAVRYQGPLPPLLSSLHHNLGINDL